MPLDYSGPRTSAARPTVNKNRPKKRAGSLFVLAILGSLAVTFAAGVMTGWLVFRHAAKKAAAAAAVAGTQPDAVSVPGAATPPGGAEGRVQEPSLTFYETLPKGGKAVIGTGLNPKREEASSAAKPGSSAPPPQAPAQPAAAPTPPSKATGMKDDGGKSQEAVIPSSRPLEKEAAKKPVSGKGNFCVQVASYKDRKEAETARAKLAARGFDAYIVESNVPDKGVWYRIRVGKHLEQVEANETVKKAGKGAIVIAE